jgi:hypothetical protein
LGYKGSMNRNGLVVALGAVALIALWLVVLWKPHKESSAAAPRTASEPAAPAAPSAVPDPLPASAPPSKPAPPIAQPSVSAPQPNPDTTSPTPRPGEIPPPRTEGPVAESIQLYATEPRASDASNLEARIAQAFRRPEVPSELLKSVICRQTVCKVEVRWTPERVVGYMGAFMDLIREFDSRQMAILPGTRDPSGVLPVDVYLRRIAPTNP